MFKGSGLKAAAVHSQFKAEHHKRNDTPAWAIQRGLDPRGSRNSVGWFWVGTDKVYLCILTPLSGFHSSLSCSSLNVSANPLVELSTRSEMGHLKERYLRISGNSCEPVTKCKRDSYGGNFAALLRNRCSFCNIPNWPGFHKIMVKQQN